MSDYECYISGNHDRTPKYVAAQAYEYRSGLLKRVAFCKICVAESFGVVVMRAAWGSLANWVTIARV